MMLVNVHFPITMPPDLTFEVKGDSELSLFGHRVTLLGTHSLQFHDVHENDAEGLISKVLSALPWTWVKLNHGFLPPEPEVKRASTAGFNGAYPTIYPADLVPSPIWGHFTLSGSEPFDKFVSSLEEGSKIPPLGTKVATALELFSTVDHESSHNSQFVLLTTALELVMDQIEQPSLCLELVEHFIRDAKSKSQNATTTEERDALAAMAQSAGMLKRRSITQSIRALASECAKINDFPEPYEYGREAGKLYGKRSSLVHDGADITGTDLHQLREKVRVILATLAARGRVIQPTTQQHPTASPSQPP
jgi:hypothetical protein